MTKAEPERELVRRVLPLAPVAIVAAYLIGYAIAGPGAGASAAIGVVAVALNFVIFALSVAWAAEISVSMLALVALGGYAFRLILFTAELLALTKLPWFSPIAFTCTLVPATIALLVYEAKVLSGRMQADLWSFDGAQR